MVPPPTYIPAPQLIASSRLTAQELVLHFEGLFQIETQFASLADPPDMEISATPCDTSRPLPSWCLNA